MSVIDESAFTVWGGSCALPPPGDPCEGVVCGNRCYGVDLHQTVCEQGECVRGSLLEANAETCGYDPGHDPEPEDKDNTMLYIGVGIAVLIVIYLIMRR